MRSALSEWDEQWGAPATRLERVAPWLAFGLAGLLAWL